MRINDFLTYYQKVNNQIRFSTGTKEFYRKHLEIIDAWFFNQGIRSLSELNIENINRFIEEQRSECSEVTINKRLGLIKRCIKSLEISSDELDQILQLKKLKEVRRSYEMLKSEELKKIVRFIKSLPNSIPNYLMYKTIILLLMDTGARIGEILAIEKRNIDLKNHEILLKKTKTKIERFVYFSGDDTKECIQELMDISPVKYLLYNQDKQRPVNYDDIRYIMKLIETKTGVRNVYPYMFRHTFATRLIENGADVFVVKELMGHEKLTTTQIYTHLSKKHIKKVYLETHHR